MNAQELNRVNSISNREIDNIVDAISSINGIRVDLYMQVQEYMDREGIIQLVDFFDSISKKHFGIEFEKSCAVTTHIYTIFLLDILHETVKDRMELLKDDITVTDLENN